MYSSVIDVLLDTASRLLPLPVHHHVVGVVVGEHAVPVGVVPALEVEVVMPLRLPATC